MVLIAVLLALAIVALVWNPEGSRIKFTAPILAALALLLALRVFLIHRKAMRFVAPDGAVLEFTNSHLIIGGRIAIPWHQVSRVLSYDGVHKIENSRNIANGIMRDIGLNFIELAFYVGDRRVINDPRHEVKGFDGGDGPAPGRIEVPFGAWFDSEQLRQTLAIIRAQLHPNVPMEHFAEPLDYAAKWVGLNDDEA